MTQEESISENDGPVAAVIIPHYNDVARLRKCLAALTPQVDPVRVEIVVVDNGSTEDWRPLQADYPHVRFVVERAKGAAPARNCGVAESTAPNLWFIDADCVPADDWVATALSLTGRDGIIGGAVLLFDETPPPRSGAEAFETVFAFQQKNYIERRNFSVTANLLTSRAVFDDTGPFDGRVVEDSDWCHRAVARGWPISFRPELVVFHPTRSSWAALKRKWSRVTAENYFANGTGVVDRIRWGGRSIAVLVSALVHAPVVLFHPALKPGERLSGLWTLFRLRFMRCLWMLRQAMFGAPPLNQ